MFVALRISEHSEPTDVDRVRLCRWNTYETCPPPRQQATLRCLTNEACMSLKPLAIMFIKSDSSGAGTLLLIALLGVTTLTLEGRTAAPDDEGHRITETAASPSISSQLLSSSLLLYTLFSTLGPQHRKPNGILACSALKYVYEHESKGHSLNRGTGSPVCLGLRREYPTTSAQWRWYVASVALNELLVAKGPYGFCSGNEKFILKEKIPQFIKFIHRRSSISSCVIG